MRSRPLWTACVAVTITVTDVEETGSISLSPVVPIVDNAVTATLSDPDGGETAITWQWAKSDTENGNLRQHHHRHVGFVHTSHRRRREMATGNGVVHRPARARARPLPRPPITR